MAMQSGRLTHGDCFTQVRDRPSVRGTAALSPRQMEQALLRFRAAMDISGDSIYLVDRATMRFVDVNQTACTRTGYTREELLGMGPQDLIKTSREDLERSYDEVIAAGEQGITTESSARYKDGRKSQAELHRRALRTGNGWIIVSIARDITERKRAERASRRISRMYGTLSATNEAILRARLPAELYQQVCNAAVFGGKLISTSVLVPGRDGSSVEIVAIAGIGEEQLRGAHISVDASIAEGRNLVGTAFRTQQPCVSNDYLNDERTRPWHDTARAAGAMAAAAVPLLRGGRAAGVLLFYSDKTGAFDEAVVKLLQRMAENVTFALENFEREAEHEQRERALLEAERRSARHSRMYAALSATNEVIFRAGGMQELFEGVCRVAVEHGGFKLATIRVLDPEDGWMRPVARHGADAGYLEHARASVREDIPEGLGPAGRAARSGEHTVINDYLSCPLLAPWHREAANAGFEASSYFPLRRSGKVFGLLSFYAGEKNVFDAQLEQLLERMAQNLSFALDSLERDAERRLAEARTAESESRFRSLTELSSDWYWEQDAEFRFSRFEGRRATGAEDKLRQKYFGKRPWETGICLEAEGDWAAHRALLQAHQPFRDLTYHRIMPDGTRRYTSVSGQPVFDADGGFSGYRGIGRDITERKRAEERIQYLATHDGLTGLPNRVMFSQMLNLAIESARRYQRTFAVLFIDLDRFKLINDTLGHEAGDALLRQTSARLKECVRASDVVARLGGDEFVVLVQEVGETGEVAAVARKILSAVIEPVMLGSQECRVTASVGVSMYPADARDEQSLMRNADMAMYLAKEVGKNNCQFYSKDIKSQSLEKMALETSLRHALERGEFLLHFQPKVDLGNGTITGVEALLRWQHPELGMVSPMQFIPLAEEIGLIVPIGRWVLRTACAQNVAWQRDGMPPVCMAVNLSPRQFNDPDMVSDIAAALRESGMAAELLELEITEGMVMHDTDRAVKLLGAIKHLGVRLAIDDFGTGYSSLAQLKRFPIDTLKVDRSFIRDIPGDPEDRAITQAIIAMGKSLSLTIVAEGVETEEQQSFLREHACDQMQGYYFSKPVVAGELAKLLRINAARNA
jgi:diguanylate cyclase (GGDEF)-like protein/PAS domain S-box-containing protein